MDKTACPRMLPTICLNEKDNRLNENSILKMCAYSSNSNIKWNNSKQDLENNENSKPKSVQEKETKSTNLQECSNNSSMNERSPDLFQVEYDEVIDSSNELIVEKVENFINSSSSQEEGNRKYDELLKRIQKHLSGLPPPPSVTICQMDLLTVIPDNKDKILDFFMNLKKSSNEEDCEFSANTSLLKPSHNLDEVKEMSWPDVLKINQHGVHYNVSATSEKFEYLNLAFIERYIGSETSSSFQTLSSNHNRHTAMSRKTCQSPGSRLSHLAKRRTVFSSANLQSTFTNNIQKTITARQLRVDSKKCENPRIKVDSTTQGAKNVVKEGLNDKESKPVVSRETSKRALFQSPPKEKLDTSKLLFKSNIANRVDKSKRALFSPEKPSQEGLIRSELKRKRIDENEIEYENHHKMSKRDSENLTPRLFQFKSQSFCVGSNTKMEKNKTLPRAYSEIVHSNQLSETHKKKLLWAVSKALQYKQIGVDHPKFKQYASVLGRAIKRLFLEFYVNLKTSSTSEIMLSLAEKFVKSVLSDKSADDIYLVEKSKREQEKSIRKITGYVTLEDYKNRRTDLKKASSAIYLDDSCDSFRLSNHSSTNVENIKIENHSNENINLSSENSLNLKNTSSLQNSTSKSNLQSVVLRENVDCEQRKSAHKNFTGQDIKNASPFIEYKGRTIEKFEKKSELKVKRQISFDN